MVSIIDDFEDGDVQGWTGDTGVFTAQTGTVLSGSYSAELSIDTANNFFNAVNRTYSATTGKFEIEFQGDQFGSDDFDGPRFRLYDDGGTKIVEVRFLGDGNVYAEDGGTLTNTGYSWTAGTTYSITVSPDFSTDSFNLVINGTTAASGYSLSNAASNHAEVQLGIFANNVSGTFYSYWDDVAAVLPPAAPSNLSVSQGLENQLDLSWIDNSDNEDGFYIYRAQTSGTTTADYTQVANVSANTTTYTDGSLEDGEKYYYRVTAYNATGESDPSNEDNAITVVPATNPSFDTTVEDEITVSWNKQDDSSDGNWEIYRSQDGTLGTEITGGLTVGTSSHTDTSLEDGEKYHYTLRRNTDHASVDAQKSAIALLPAATAVSLDASVEDEVTVSWTRNDDSSDGEWEVYASTDGTLGTLVGDALALSTTSFTHTGLNDGEKYYYTVRRITDHTSTDSTQVSAITVLPAPSGVTIGSITATSIPVSWTVNHDYGSQRVDYRRTSDTAWTTYSSGLALSTTSETVDGLLNGEKYDVRVVATTEHTETVDST